MRPTDGSVRRALRATCATMAAWLVGAAGCVSPTPPPAAAPRAARIDLVNLSECEWRVTIATLAGVRQRTVNLFARETAHLELPGGDYAITQTALAGIAGPELTRQFSARLDADESYRWRLATLFTATAAAP